MNTNATASFEGKLSTRLIRKPAEYLVRRLNLPVVGPIAWCRDPGEAMIPGCMMFASKLVADHYDADGNLKARYNLGSGVVTTAGVTLLAADWTNATATLKLAKFHDCGTGTTAPAIGDTALVTPYGGARATGSQSNAANVYTTVATVSFTSTLAITEWGLFTASTSTTLWDRKTFSAINVVSGDSIQFTYDLTCTAGG